MIKYLETNISRIIFFQLVNKFGVDKEEKGPNKNRLWAKVTKEYNNITGNGHTKARLNKKWQNIKHQRKLKRQKLFDHEADDDPDALVDEDGELKLRYSEKATKIRLFFHFLFDIT